MSFDPSRLYAILLNTGLQSKDNALYQLLHDLIKIVAGINTSVSAVVSGSGLQGPQGIQGIQGIPGMEGEGSLSSTDDFIAPVDVIQNLVSLFNWGDILVGGLSGRITSIPDVAVNSILRSGGVGVIPAWSDNINLGVAGSGFFNVNGKIAVTFSLADNAIFAHTVSATFPAVITANRTAINYDVISAGSSGFAQIGVNYTLHAGYTGSAACLAVIIKSDVANPNNQTTGLRASMTGVGLSNCALSGVSTGATNGNIGVYGGIGGFTEGNFNFNITAAILASNGATANDIYRGYSSTNLRFQVTDAGNIIITGSITCTSYTHSGAEIDKTYQVYAPLTGATITMNAGQSRAIINPAGLIAALTITLPPSPVDGQVVGFSFTQAVTVLTVNAPGGATVAASPTSAAIDTNLRFLYQASSTTWFPAS